MLRGSQMSSDQVSSYNEQLVATNEGIALAHFKGRPAEYGDSYLSVDWGSANGQALRFQALSHLVRLPGSSLLDIGCGVGHLVSWLETESIHLSCYQGIDITPSMVEAAASLYPNSNFSCGNIFSDSEPLKRNYDIVFASGIFYLAIFKSYEYLEATISRMFQLCNVAIVFNLLVSPIADTSFQCPPGEFVAHIPDVLQIVEKYSRLYRIDHSYNSHDLTVAIYRSPS